jgi:hypothetical protein
MRNQVKICKPSRRKTISVGKTELDEKSHIVDVSIRPTWDE